MVFVPASGDCCAVNFPEGAAIGANVLVNLRAVSRHDTWDTDCTPAGTTNPNRCWGPLQLRDEFAQVRLFFLL
jgi:hypothetical protein